MPKNLGLYSSNLQRKVYIPRQILDDPVYFSNTPVSSLLNLDLLRGIYFLPSNDTRRPGSELPIT